MLQFWKQAHFQNLQNPGFVMGAQKMVNTDL